MNPSKNITSYHSLKVIIERKPSEALIQHLKKTVLGTPGGLRYMHTEQEKKLRHIGEAYFMLLYKSNFMLGSVGFCLRETYTGAIPEKSWYIRYFSINAPLREKKGHNKNKKTKPDAGVSILRGAAMPYFENPDIFQQPDSKIPHKSIIFSYIDKENPRSSSFSEQMGFVTIRQLSSILFSRFNPKHSTCVKRITEHQKPEILAALKEFYSGYTMFQDRYIFFEDNYYLAYENGEIVAGLQANPEEWQIVEMGKAMGFIFKIIPLLPGLKRIFNPEKFRFLAVEGIWYKKGKARYISKIIESVLSTSGLNIAMCWQDSQSQVKYDLLKAGRRGVLGRLFKAGDGDIKVRFISFTEEEKQVYYENPAYLSAFEMS